MIFFLNYLVRQSKPLYMLLAGLMYVLGGGISRYLGYPHIAFVFWLGLLGTLLAQMSMGLLGAIFQQDNGSGGEGRMTALRARSRDAGLYLSISALAALGLIVFNFAREGILVGAAYFFLGTSVLLILLYAVPPARLQDRGFGELLLGIQIAYVAPSIAFLLQTGGQHRLLNATTLPLTLILFAALLAFDFPTYAEDLRRGRATLVVRMGWENAVPLHDALLIAAYALLLYASVFGFSFKLLWPAFLTLPFAILQILLLRGIAQGAKPIWSLLRTNALAIFCLTAYFLTLGYWLR